MRMEVLKTDRLTKEQARFALHSFCLLSIEKGNGFLTINGIKRVLVKKAIFLLHPGTIFSIESNEKNELCGCMLLFDLYKEKSRTAQELVYEKVRTFPIEGLVAYHRSAICRLLSVIHTSKAGPSYIGQAVAIELLHWLFDQPSSVRLEHNEKRIQKTIEYMNAFFTKPVSLESLADMAGTNPAYYSSLFKQKMNKTPMEWLAHLRLNRAKVLFLTGKIKIKEAARQTGYEDEHYFSRRFKQTFGMAPSYYRPDQIQKVISLSYPYTDHLLTLGITPVAGQLQDSFDSRIKELTLPYHASDPWDIQRQFFLEKKPDLILCKNNVADAAKEQVGDIAPIVSIDWTSMDVYGHADAIARLLGKEAYLTRWRAAHDEKAAKAREAVERRIGTGRSASLWSVTDKGIRLYGTRNIGHVFYRLLGFHAPPCVQKKINEHPIGTSFTWMAASLNEMQKDTSDYIWIIIQDEQHRRMIEHQLAADPLLAAHPAVRGGRCFFLEWKKWIVYAPLGIEKQLEEAVRFLLPDFQ